MYEGKAAAVERPLLLLFLAIISCGGGRGRRGNDAEIS